MKLYRMEWNANILCREYREETIMLHYVTNVLHFHC